MISYDKLYQDMAACELAPWQAQIESLVDQAVDNGHGDLFRWQGILNQLPDVLPSDLKLNQACPSIGASGDLTESEQANLKNLLLQLQPWRKGPFNLFGIHIDSEWRSDMKWQRLESSLLPLENKLVLDVGGGNGYYALRMAGAGAKFILSIDPTWLFVIQFAMMSRYLGKLPVHTAPLAMEQLPENMRAFDTVFSMGILYHRRSPIIHLQEIMAALKPGGQLVLETLVLDSEKPSVLVPESRYAKMRNVWFIPSLSVMTAWLEKTGFLNIVTVDVTPTTSNEQRQTEWMRFESLVDYLDPADPTRTIEGHPAPLRAIFTAEKPY